MQATTESEAERWRCERPVAGRRHGRGHELFNGSAAKQYDEDGKAMARRYKSAHAVQNDFVTSALKRARARNPVVIDFGCGTGSDAVQILKRSAASLYVGVDFSKDMLEQAEAKLEKMHVSKRSMLLCHDFRSFTANACTTALLSRGYEPAVHCVLSSLALHHYAPSTKRSVFALARSLLPKGGTFVLTDLYTSGIPFCAEELQKLELIDIQRTRRRLTRNGGPASALSTITTQHYLYDNRPATLLGEVSLIREAGFPTADIAFRFGQLAVIVATG